MRIVVDNSGGLHHVMAPGQSFPRLFRRLVVNLESLDVSEYLAAFNDIDDEKRQQQSIDSLIVFQLDMQKCVGNT